MLERICTVFTDVLIKKGIVKEEEKEVYVYGSMLSLTTFLGMLSIILISLLFKWYFGFLFLIIYTPLRVYAGGYHCNTYLSCFIVTNIVFVLNVCFVMLLGAMSVLGYTVVTAFVLGLSYIYILLNAPIVGRENPLSSKRKAKNRKRSIVVASVLVILAILLRVFGSENLYAQEVYFIITSAELTVSVLMNIQKIKERRTVKNA
ncbi:MAG: accessory gene regulator B family protein [Clostridia bacterium]|nr:accessory gene regulator B family protein [Clostridia bacterium]